ncbi:MAG: DUF1926 domain-containing protein [bacterium]|nr:DUF1926 domain-containing protein [bacterium]
MSTLILGIHNHQPVGNFDHVIDDAQKRAYLPFLETLEKHPAIKMAVHTSGPLFEWQKRETPDYIERLRVLVERGQVEIVGGGYWEPILTVLPEKDQHAQIERMCREMETTFGSRPRGLWLAERIWEPHLPRILAAHGLEYVALDDSHFRATGFADRDLRGYYLTEEGGESLAVFPISFQLRHLVPFHPVEKVIAHLQTLGDEPGNDLGLLMDDGEKFGVWSSTNKLCYREGYLKRLFAALVKEPNLELSTFGEFLDNHPPLGVAYLPTASYHEMGEWALPCRAQKGLMTLTEFVKEEKQELTHFVSGGFWRNFFVKYEESHWMHKRMLHLGRRLEAERATGRLPDSTLEQAEDLKLQAQCNCAYWHGLFGGLYLPHLRHAIFERLIRAEALIASDENTLTVEDLDFDGDEEIVWTTPRAQAFIKPRGGRVRELDFLDIPFPLTNVLSRREEIYHEQLLELAAIESKRSEKDDETEESVKSIHEIVAAKERGLEKFLIYDPHPRASLEERLYPAGKGDAGYNDSWFDFSSGLFAVDLPAESDGELRLHHDAEFEPGRTLSLTKVLSWADGGATLVVRLELSYDGPGCLEARFASGWNLNFLAPAAPDRKVLVDGRPARRPQLRSKGWERAKRSLALHDEWSGVAVTMQADEVVDFYREPIETVSLSEAGFERVYQGSWIAACRDINIESGAVAVLSYRIAMTSLK